MKKAMISITKKLVIDNSVTDTILREIFDAAYSEVTIFFQNARVVNYSLTSTEYNMQQIGNRVNHSAQAAAINALFKLNGIIPNFWDDSKRINFKTPSIRGGYFPEVEVIEYIQGQKERFKIAVYFKTEPLILLDSIGQKLLLSVPHKIDGVVQSQEIIANTFFLQLTDDLFFSDYTPLQ